MRRTTAELLREADAYDRLGFAGRPDDSGIRAKGVNRQPDQRLKDFPYDKDVFYGQPAAYDRGSSAAGPLERPLTPKDDEHFSLTLLDLEELVREVMGSPILLARAGSSQVGSSVPGVGGSWANDPPKAWDPEPETKEEFDPEVPEVEPVPRGNLPDFRGQTDDDLENRLDRIWGQGDNPNLADPMGFANPDFHIIAPDPWSVINRYLTGRGLKTVLGRESAWDRVTGIHQRR